MFVGTILHSLDHTLMGWNLEDPLWLDVESDECRTGSRICEVLLGLACLNDGSLRVNGQRYHDEARDRLRVRLRVVRVLESK